MTSAKVPPPTTAFDVNINSPNPKLPIEEDIVSASVNTSEISAISLASRRR